MVSHSAHSRPNAALSPALALGVILLALCVVEALLVARFSLHLFAAAASEGLGALVLDATQPLVAPFSDEPVTPQPVGWVDRGTLLAAAVYLVAALGLMTLTAMTGGMLAGRNVLANRRRREGLQRLRQATRLIGTASLGISPEQAARALRLLRLDDLGADLFVIPAEGGCIVAGFTDASPAHGFPWFGLMRSTREVTAVRRTLREIERRFQAPQQPPGRTVRKRRLGERPGRAVAASSR